MVMDMEDNQRPVVVVSKCMGFESCRYDGQMKPDKFVEKLEGFVEYIKVCPEVEIGLGIPRKPIRLILENNNVEVYQPETEKFFTEKMRNYTDKTLKSFKVVDGFLLKSRSPSCGIKDVKLYNGKGPGVVSTKSSGIFAEGVLGKYPYLAVESEGRLTNFNIREHFLTKLYINCRFRSVIESKDMAELVKFHSINKYLLMAYNQKELKLLGKIVANHEKKKFDALIMEYRDHLGMALIRLPRKSNYVNSLMHMFGYFSDNISLKEKEFILHSFDKYKEGKEHLSVPLNILKTYVIKYEQDYLVNQTIWSPYPEGLIDLSDSGKMI